MNDHPYLDLLDEVNCADSCEAVIALCELIDQLIEDIQVLELECISTRYSLSQHLDDNTGESLRRGILSNLARRYDGDPAYDMFKTIIYSGGDPMEFRDYHVKVQNACEGKWPYWH